MVTQSATGVAISRSYYPFLPFFHSPAWKHVHDNAKAKSLKKEPTDSPQQETPKSNHVFLQEHSDFELIDLAINGQHEAFDVLMRRYGNSIYALAYRILRNHEDAADICQDVFLKAYEALSSFRKKSSFHTWLYRIATNSCINFLRKYSAQHHVEFATHYAVKEADTLDTLYKIELQEVVNDAIEKLPEKQKATVMLRVCEGMSHREVSKILKCSVGTAKANYFHAIRNLRRFLKNYIVANEEEEIIPTDLLRTGGISYISTLS